MSRGSTYLLGTAAVLAIIFVVQETWSRRPPTRSLELAPELISRVVFEPATDELVVNGDDWAVNGFPATAESVQDVLAALAVERTLPIVSRNAQGLERFGLGDAARQVVVFDGQTELARLAFGDRSAGGDGVYARLNDASEVLLAPQELAELGDLDEFELRDKNMLAFSEAEIREVRIAIPGLPTSVLARTGAAADADAADQTEVERIAAEWSYPDAISAREVQSLLEELQNMQATGFPRQRQIGDVVATVVVVPIRGEEVTLDFHAPNTDLEFPVTSNHASYDFYYPAWRVRRVLVGRGQYIDTLTSGV